MLRARGLHVSVHIVSSRQHLFHRVFVCASNNHVEVHVNHGEVHVNHVEVHVDHVVINLVSYTAQG